MTTANPSESKTRTNYLQREYWRVFVTYSDGETSAHRVYKTRERAELYAERKRLQGFVARVACRSQSTW